MLKFQEPCGGISEEDLNDYFDLLYRGKPFSHEDDAAKTKPAKEDLPKKPELPEPYVCARSGYVTNLMAQLTEEVTVSDAGRNYNVPSPWPPFWSSVYPEEKQPSYIHNFRSLKVPSPYTIDDLEAIDVHGMVSNLRLKGVHIAIPELDFFIDGQNNFEGLLKWAVEHITVTYNKSTRQYVHNAPIYWKGITALNIPNSDKSEVKYKCDGIKQAIIEANVKPPPKHLEKLLENEVEQDLFRKHAGLAWRKSFRRFYNTILNLLENTAIYDGLFNPCLPKPD